MAKLILITFRGTVSRRQYFLTGVLLFLLKIGIDEFTSTCLFGRTWQLSNYYKFGVIFSLERVSVSDAFYYSSMTLIALPFIWIGMSMSVRRLRDLKLPPALALLFLFRPFNWLLIVALSLVSKSPLPPESDCSDLSLERLLSRDDYIRAFQIAAVAVVMAVVCGFLAVSVLNTYGSGLFVGVPVVMGYVIGSLDGYYTENYNRAFGLSFYISLCTCAVLIAFAIEGFICLIMAFPIVLVLMEFGTLIGHATSRTSLFAERTYLMMSPVVTLPLLMIFEAGTLPPPPLLHVRSEVIVNAPIRTVWNHVISFPTISAPTEALFKTGIAYPIDATITGKGIGAVRHCNFSTGTFVEPITNWNEPKLLQFSVLKQPEPMVELSPYDIHPRHLEGYLKCERGEFRLVALSNNRTELIGTTWYRDNVWPQEYWSLYSNAIIHQIHLRVLNHIKQVSEKMIR